MKFYKGQHTRSFKALTLKQKVNNYMEITRVGSQPSGKGPEDCFRHSAVFNGKP